MDKGNGWHAKFSRPADSKDRGFGHTPEQVAALESDAETLLAYHRAVSERSKKFFLTLSDDDLDRELNEPQYQPLPTVGVRLVSVMPANLQPRSGGIRSRSAAGSGLATILGCNTDRDVDNL